MIRVERLVKHFGPTRAVDGISFRVSAGEVVGFLGPNGAGKSTTIRVLTCFLPPTAGKAEVAGFDIFRRSREVRARIGYLPETVPLYPEMRVKEYLRFRGRLKGVERRRLKQRLPEVMELCGITEVARKLVGHVSRGYRQRVALADALVAEPPIIILDEPTSGLDPNQRRKVKELIRHLAGRHTILFSSHILAEVEAVFSRVMIIHRGKLVGQGTREELVRQLGGGERLTLEVACPPGEVLPLVAKLTGCAEPAHELQPDGFIRVEAPLAEGRDPRVACYTWAREKEIVLRQLAIHAPSLEEVFAGLTSREPDEAVPHAAGAVAAPAGEGEA